MINKIYDLLVAPALNSIRTRTQLFDSNGNIVTSTNPLPTTLQSGTSSAVESSAGRSFNIRATKGAVLGEFARLQIYNAGSTSQIINAITAWAGTAGTHLYSVYRVGSHDASAALSNVQANFKIGSSTSSSIEVYGASSATAIPTTGLVGGNSSTAVAIPGVSLIFSGGNITIAAGETLEIAIGTANTAFTINVTDNVLPT